MKFLRSFFTCLLLLTLAAASSFTKDVNSNAGTSAFPFLKIDVSARAVAMGGAFTGLADDESAMYYNPAGIAHFEDKRFIATYHNYFDDMQSGFLGFVKPLKIDKSYFGLYISYLNYGKFTETDNSGTVLGDFSGGDLVLAGTIAFRQGISWKFGATTKLIYEKIQDYSATGAALDIGAKYTSNREYYSAGIAVQNIGFQLSSLGEEKDKLPLTVRGGGSARLKGLPLLLAADLIVPIDNDMSFAVGGEFTPVQRFQARLGWNTFGSNYQAANSDDNWAGLGIGFGFDITEKLNLAYAFMPGAELGESHRITISGGF